MDTMSEWLNSAFPGSVLLTRINFEGITLMALALVMILIARPVSNRCPALRRQVVCGQLRLVGILLCLMGAAAAVL